MSLIRSFLGRRQFLIVVISSFIMALLGGIGNAFDFLLKGGIAKASGKAVTDGKKALKGCVVYYSGTGSTAKIAGAIYRGVNKVMECDVAPVEKMAPKKMGKYNFIAVGSPIWFYRETANLRLFIYNMPQMTDKPCVLFCTHGTTPQGMFYSLAQPLRKKGFKIIGWNDWYGDTLQYKQAVQPYITHGHPDKIDLQEAESFGKEMAERAQRVYAGEKDLIPEIPIDSEENLLWRRQGIMGGGGGGNMPAGGAGNPPPGSAEASGPGTVVGAIAAGTTMAGSALEGMPDMNGGGVAAVPDMAAPQGGAPSGGGTPGRDGAVPMMPISAGGEKGIGSGTPEMSMSGEVPVIDTTKCVYPRCRACMDNCIADAIDLSMAAPAAWISGLKIFIKGCQRCGFPLCQRACSYDAITYKGQRTEYSFNRTKCTYPKCNLCVDRCPMRSLEFSNNMLIRHNNCEGCDLCWSICPTGAIEIVNQEDRMNAAQLIERLKIEIKESPQYKHYRQLLPDGEWGKEGKQWYSKKLPRVVLNEKDWPYELKE